jgi:hypothetical protein
VKVYIENDLINRGMGLNTRWGLIFVQRFWTGRIVRRGLNRGNTVRYIEKKDHLEIQYIK